MTAKPPALQVRQISTLFPFVVVLALSAAPSKGLVVLPDDQPVAASSHDANKSLAKGMPYPVQVSDNRRYLIDQEGNPFFYLGDTAWELFH
jgi:Protein of unknown function (DUF4038)